MSDPAEEQQIDAGRGYEELLVPALFRQWAPLLLDAANVRPGAHVLDVACGTGVLAREAVRRVGSSGRVVGVDPLPGMLAVAMGLGPTVEWKPGTAEALPVADETFDAVVSQFGLMFFEDRERALQEMLRVCKPGGTLAVAVWDSLERNNGYADEVALLERMAGSAAADAVRAPFVLGDRDRLLDLFRGLDIGGLAIQTRSGTARFPDIGSMLEADLRGWLPVLGVDLGEDQIQEILCEAESALARYIGADGIVRFPLSVHIVTGLKASRR